MTVGIRAAYRKKLFDENEGMAEAFSSLGELTGGRSFDPPDLNASTARSIIQFLADEVRAEYIAGFSPEAGMPPVSRQIVVRLKGHKEAKIVGGTRVAVY